MITELNKQINKHKKRAIDNIIKSNPLLTRLKWEEQSKIKGTPEYCEKLEKKYNYLVAKIALYNNLPWYKKIFKGAL